MAAPKTWTPYKMKARVHELLATDLGLDESEITADSLIMDDLGADSLDVVEMAMSLEEEFEIEISEDDAEKAKTVSALERLVASKLRSRLQS
jgi:acyl carrier protein